MGTSNARHHKPKTWSDMDPTRCAVCDSSSRYVCPRCNAPYCSVDCYKRHSEACSREFEEEHFREELSSVSADLDTQNMMKDILVKLHRQELEGNLDWDDVSEGDEDEEVVPGLSNQRLKALADGELQLDDLNEAERQAVKTSMLHDIQVDAWVPWWESEDARDVRLSPDGRRLVQLIEPDNDDQDTVYMPGGPREPIPSLSSLSSKEPSDVILLHVLDVIYWYCLLLRLFNGDIELSGEQLVTVLIDHSPSLSTSKTVSKSTRPATPRMNADHAGVRAFAEELMDRCQDAGFFTGMTAKGIAAGVLKDTAVIFSLRRAGVLLALSDVFETAKSVKGQGSTARQRQVTFIERKLLYLLSWANERVDDIATLVSSELESLYDEVMKLIKIEVDGESEVEEVLRLP